MFRVFSVNLFVIVKADSCSELREDMLEGFKAVYSTSYSYGTLLTNMGKKFQTPYIEIQTVRV
jgi:hypothetical protein